MSIIIKPILTEKMNKQAEKNNSYGFVVDKRSNKILIKKEVEKIYNVIVKDVNTINQKPKFKTKFTKKGFVESKKNSIKKAIVKLEKDNTIDFYTSV